MTSLETWITVWLRVGIQKSMPLLVRQIKHIKLESDQGTKLWVSRVEPVHPKKIHVLVQLTKGKRHEELVDVDPLLRKLKATIHKIILPKYRKDLIVQNVSDGCSLQDANPSSLVGF